MGTRVRVTAHGSAVTVGSMMRVQITALVGTVGAAVFITVGMWVGVTASENVVTAIVAVVCVFTMGMQVGFSADGSVATVGSMMRGLLEVLVGTIAVVCVIVVDIR
jgi:hypothetical protein